MIVAVAVVAVLAVAVSMVGAAASEAEVAHEDAVVELASDARDQDLTIEGLTDDLGEAEAKVAITDDRESELDTREAELDKRLTDLDARGTALDTRDKELGKREVAVGIAEATKKANSFDSGTYVVGKDIKPGTYKTSGSSDMCYWERLRGLSGGFGDIIANGLPTGQALITISSSDVAFKTQGCETWTKVG